MADDGKTNDAKPGDGQGDAKTSILIVDDLPEKILAYRSVLEELGQNVVAASSGAEALKQVLRNDFAVILLDVNMPDMDGFETARLIRQRRLSAHVPIIFLTAFADEVRTAEGYATGGVDYLPTPVVPEILRAKVRVFVDLFRMRQQVAHQAEEQAKRAAAEEAARRSEFLAEASRALAGSLDVATTLARLARAAVPFLCDLASARLVGDPPRAVAAAWVDPDGTVHESSGGPAFDGRLADVIARTLANGRAERLGSLGPGDARSPDATGSMRSALVLPLTARGTPLGALVLARGPGRPPFDDQDAALADDLAARGGISLDNALLVRNIQDADRRKDEFLAMLAHELRNPLAPVRTGLDLLRRSGADPEVVEPMGRQVEHLVRLVDDLLDVSRITRGTIELRRQPVDLRRVVASAVETSRPLVEARRHELQVAVADVPLPVAGDPVRLTQVLTNLLNNAAKYTPEGGHLSLSADREGGEVVVRVGDTGHGVAAEMLPRIFDLFVQADRSLDRAQGGLGIGLTLVRRLVEMHLGRVEAFSEGPGLGSEFVVRLPFGDMVPEPIADPAPAEALPEADRPRSRILVVDDNVDAAATLGMLLRLDGHELRIAHDGPSALTAAAEFVPHVVLLDIGLPGLNGYEVARRLRGRTDFDAPLLIAVSGYGQEDDRTRSREAGFDHHLTKPVDFAVLRRFLSRSPSAVGAP